MKVIYNDGHVGEIEKDQELHVIRHTAGPCDGSGH